MSAVHFPQASPVASTWDVPPGWQQGRGAWGGLVVAAAVRAAEAAERAVPAEAVERTVRSVSVQMLAPVLAGPALVRTAQLRRGSATACWRVEVHSGGEHAAEAAVVLGDARAADLSLPQSVPPEVTAWADAPVIEVAPPLGPDFAVHLQFRPLSGYPYSGVAGETWAWVRPREVADRYDAGALLGLVDAMWPATLLAVTAPRPMATLSFSASLLLDPAQVDSAEPLLHRGSIAAAADGYVTETRHLWTASGQLAVVNTQVVAVIR